MILHDRVNVVLQIDTGQTDEHGNPIYETTQNLVPAAVWPLDTEAVLEPGNTAVLSRYRVALGRTAGIPADIGGKVWLGWGPYPVDVTDPNNPADGLRVDGAVERHMMRGRLHHYELITKVVT